MILVMTLRCDQFAEGFLCEGPECVIIVIVIYETC